MPAAVRAQLLTAVLRRAQTAIRTAQARVKSFDIVARKFTSLSGHILRHTLQLGHYKKAQEKAAERGRDLCPDLNPLNPVSTRWGTRRVHAVLIVCLLTRVTPSCARWNTVTASLQRSCDTRTTLDAYCKMRKLQVTAIQEKQKVGVQPAAAAVLQLVYHPDTHCPYAAQIARMTPSPEDWTYLHAVLPQLNAVAAFTTCVEGGGVTDGLQPLIGEAGDVLGGDDVGVLGEEDGDVLGEEDADALDGEDDDALGEEDDSVVGEEVDDVLGEEDDDLLVEEVADALGEEDAGQRQMLGAVQFYSSLIKVALHAAVLLPCLLLTRLCGR